MNIHPIITTLIKRIALGIVSLFFVTLIIFSSVNLLPGDFVESVLGQARTEASVRIFRAELGLDKPYHIRYFNWLSSAVKGDLGSTFSEMLPMQINHNKAQQGQLQVF